MNFWIIVFDLFVWLSVLATVYLVGWMVYDLWHTRARWPGAMTKANSRASRRAAVRAAAMDAAGGSLQRWKV